MQTRRVNSILGISAALLLAGAAAALALGALLPLATASNGEASINRPTTREGRSRGNPDIADFEPVLARDWRAPLSDSAPPAPAEAGASDGTLTLAGTVGTSLALVRRADGTVEIKGVGDTIDGAELIAIRPREIELRRSDGAHTILRKAVEPEP